MDERGCTVQCHLNVVERSLCDLTYYLSKFVNFRRHEGRTTKHEPVTIPYEEFVKFVEALESVNQRIVDSSSTVGYWLKELDERQKELDTREDKLDEEPDADLEEGDDQDNESAGG